MPEDVALERLTFEDLGDGRIRLVASLVDSFEGRDAFGASGMEDPGGLRATRPASGRLTRQIGRRRSRAKRLGITVARA